MLTHRTLNLVFLRRFFFYKRRGKEMYQNEKTTFKARKACRSACCFSLTMHILDALVLEWEQNHTHAGFRLSGGELIFPTPDLYGP